MSTTNGGASSEPLPGTAPAARKLALQPGPLAAAARKSLGLSLRALGLPGHLAVRCLAWWSGLLLQAFTWVGATPAGFVPAKKVG